MGGTEANFLDPLAFDLIRKKDYKGFQVKESTGGGNCISQCRNILIFLIFILSHDIIYSNVKKEYTR